MSDYTYSVSTPADNSTIAGLPSSIRSSKIQLATRINVEHLEVVTGSGDDDCGGVHQLGSARIFCQAAEPTLVPDSVSGAGGTSATALTIVDTNGDTVGLGRLWVDTDTDVLYYYNGTTWTGIAISGGIGGSDVVLSEGRSGGQTINGGTATTEGLTFKANNQADGTGTILFEGANAESIDFDSIPVSNLILATNLDADSTNTIINLSAPTAAGHPLVKGSACISATELLTSGMIGQWAFGSVSTTGDSTTKTIDIGFSPNLIIAWNDVNSGSCCPIIWSSLHSTFCKRFDGGTITSTPPVTVSSTTITFVDESAFVNKDDAIFYYIAVKFNAVAGTPT